MLKRRKLYISRGRNMFPKVGFVFLFLTFINKVKLTLLNSQQQTITSLHQLTSYQHVLNANFVQGWSS